MRRPARIATAQQKGFARRHDVDAQDPDQDRHLRPLRTADAVWGIGDVFRGGRQITTVVEVGDIAIDQRELSRAVSLELRRLQPQFGNRLTPELARA
jgi:hypothetical protein